MPALPASLTLAGPPRPTTTEQRLDLTFEGAPMEPQDGTVEGSVETTIRALPRQESSVRQLIDVWAVERVNHETGATSVEVYRLVHPSDDPLATNPGIWLVGMAWQDEVRGEVTFEPSGNGLWILPTPVTLAAEDGVQYVGSATDPQTLTTLALVRNVTGRSRVDVCGEFVDTFTVEMTGTLTTATDEYLVDWTQQVATTYGGVDVAQTLTLSSL